MELQQQTVVTRSAGRLTVHPVYVISQPYQTASVVNSYRRRQSIVTGILLIVCGSLSIIFNIVDLAIGTKYYSYRTFYSRHDDGNRDTTLSHDSLGVLCHGFFCGVLVSILLGPPYGIGHAIIFLPCGFCLSSSIYLSFFRRLISAVADWMSTILPHMMWH